MVLNNLASFLGLMQRSGNISYGETLIEEIRKNKVFVVIISDDIGETSKKKIVDKCTYYKIPYFIALDKIFINAREILSTFRRTCGKSGSFIIEIVKSCSFART